MSIEEANKHVVFKLVLTGGPCSGKTTGQARLSSMLEMHGWKVYRVPETANVLLGGGVNFGELNAEQVESFQENLLLTMMAIEKTFFELAHMGNKNCIVICDRGTMDPSAFVDRATWNRIIRKHGLNDVDLRDNRYNQILHLVSAAKGAEKYYTTAGHGTRKETLEEARERDDKASQAWVGHPYIEVIDNSTDFEGKMKRALECVCRKLRIPVDARLQQNSRKIKFLVKSMPDEKVFPPFQDFEVIHDYLISSDPQKLQMRLRKRGQNGHWSYTYTQRQRDSPDDQVIEIKRTINHRDYANYLAQRDPTRLAVFKRRRCFIWNMNSYQLDSYKQPCNPRCEGLIILEVYTNGGDIEKLKPDFLDIVRDVSLDPEYSMYNLAKLDNSPSNVAQTPPNALLMTSSIANANLNRNSLPQAHPAPTSNSPSKRNSASS
ncbi:TRPL translocation defect protein 14-like isoform X3 [Varroa jacobsoni]|nr:TRPL translocation defect protein 14-like isoform X3 [Varroa destructor]XP_022645537.1 TRPL translocation defect protein 14-like isoform X3 [Varroa destructor]XP_022645538.1 TRPL translocation defect protein 14-like isoform X3 [Varroa destructor]XP_022645539.1 TRPL translocation defect protein 14-like isoform X3 [Varroa destructor]XP_022645540.1 TRPL translocation defect protein 14-like isoform X3 [Varroa destructor]XP_022692895.1 TRPL translocation defect protein 14-like isoform X3 [Varroa